MTFYLYSFNNYYNRIVKKFNTIQEYPEPLHVLTAANFNPNDGISANHTFNYFGDTPDYCIVVNNENQIVSRWFVIEAVRTAGGQYRIDLYRDVIADWYDEIVAAPAFIEKAFVKLGDPAIFNNENMGFNQIKTSETLLKDAIGIPWIVGYVARNYTGGAINVPSSNVNINYTYDEGALDQYPYYAYNSVNPYVPSNGVEQRNFRFNLFNRYFGAHINYATVIDNEGQVVKPHFDISDGDYVFSTYAYRTRPSTNRGYAVPYSGLAYERAAADAGIQIYEASSDINWSLFTNAQLGISTQDKNSSTILAEEGKIIKAGSQYFKVHVNQKEKEWLRKTIPTSSSVGLVMQNVINNCPIIDKNSMLEPVFEAELQSVSYWFSFENISIDELTVTVSGNDRPHLEDSPYDMFAIPYGVASFDIGNTITTNKEVGLRIAAEIAEKLGENLYDIQVLPFAPFELENNNSAWVIKEDTIDVIKQSSSSVNFLAWLSSSNFTRYLDISIAVPTSDLEFKVANECDMYRIVSPNYNGTFEFTATKNNGVKRFRIDCRYKPYQPYIRIAPEFNGLYGQIQSDARGLVCGGDFSLTQISNAWVNYQIQNKNFQNIFDRQIENIEFNNNVARFQETIGMATGTLSGGVTGALGGATMAGAAGGIAGAAIGTGASLAGGVADLVLNERLRNEALDLTRDQFGYQLGNIKALPLNLTKVSSFNPNNKIFPVLEYYTCTDIEKQALRDKITYNGMTVMRIGTIEQFQQSTPTYIKGQLIRLENMGDDYHVSSAIANEIYKGVYI